MTLTDLSKQLKETFLRQLREEELRAKRALRIFEHQQKQIQRLQKLSGDFSYCGHSDGVAYTDADKQAVVSSSKQDQNGNYYDDFKFKSIDLINLKESNVGVQEVQSYNIPIQIKHEENIIQTNEELDTIQKEMQFTKQVLLCSKRKIQNLEDMIQKVQESNSETNIKESLVEEMTTYKKTIEIALNDLETNFISDRVLKTALRFFNVQETLHVLSSVHPLPRKVGINKSENSISTEL